MSSNFLKILQVLYRIQQDRISYRELIEFLYGETPPEDHNFLARMDPSVIAEEESPAGYIRTQKVMPPDRSPRFSVVVPTYNGASSEIRRTIASLISQAGVLREEYEIIIVDDGSTDDTARVVKEELRPIADSRRFSYIRLKKNCGPAVARNVGIASARGEYVCFTDDDCTVPEDWILNFGNGFKKSPGAAGVGGWFVLPSRKNTLLHKYYTVSYFGSPHPEGKEEYSTAQSFDCGISANVCYKKSALEKAGGFNCYLPFPCFEDMELKIRMKKNGFLLLCHPCHVQHLAPISFRTFFKRTPRRGWSRFLIRLMHPEYSSHLYSDKYGPWNGSVWKVRNLRFLKKAGVSISFLDRFCLRAVMVLEEVLYSFGKYWVTWRLLR